MSTASATHAPRVSIKSVALPAEHGGWGFLLEPILLGLLAAFTPAGLLLGIAALGVFLIHQPLKIAIKDRRKGKRYARTTVAEQFAAGYAAAALVGLTLATALGGFGFWLPLLLAVPLGMVQLAYDTKNDSRALLPELAGALALGAVAPAMAILGGWSLPLALMLWLVLGLRAVTSILYVRARLRIAHNKPAQVGLAMAAHVAALVTAAGFALSGSLVLTWAVVLAFAVLLVRAALSLYRPNPDTRPKKVGFREMALGLMTVLLTAAGLWWL